MFAITLVLILLLLGVCGATYKSRVGKTRANKRKLKKIAKATKHNVNLCQDNEKSLLKVTNQLEEFARRVAFNLHSVDWILTQQLDIKNKIEKAEAGLEKVRGIRKRKNPTYITSQSKETLI